MMALKTLPLDDYSEWQTDSTRRRALIDLALERRDWRVARSLLDAQEEENDRLRRWLDRQAVAAQAALRG